MKNRKPNVVFSGVGLNPEQRAFVNSVISGKGFENPLEQKLRSLYGAVVRAIERLNEPYLFGPDNISLDYQDMFQMKLENLEIALVEYWKHSNKLSGVVNSEIAEINRFDAIYATTTPPPPRKKIYGTDRNESFPSEKDKVGCLENIADFYDRLITSINYCTARSEMSQTQNCDFGPFDSILGDADGIISGVDRGVECGPGCCDPCTKLPCTGLQSVCFGLDGIVDHIVSIKNSIVGQRGIDAALQLAYDYSLGVDRLTAEFHCLIDKDDKNYCKQTRYAERFALARRIANELAQGDTNMAQILNTMFNDKFVLKQPISPRLILDERIRKKIQQLLRSNELSKLKYDEPDDTCGCPEYVPPEPPTIPRRRRPPLPPAPVARPRIPPPLPPPPARYRAPQLPNAIPPLVAPPPFIPVSPDIPNEGGGTEPPPEETTVPPPDGGTEDPGTTEGPGDGDDGWWSRSFCCGDSCSSESGSETPSDSNLSSLAEGSAAGGGEFGSGPTCVSACNGVPFDSPWQCPPGTRGALPCCCPALKRWMSSPCSGLDGSSLSPSSSLAVESMFKKRPLEGTGFPTAREYYEANGLYN